jgi:hypothetical protein
MQGIFNLFAALLRVALKWALFLFAGAMVASVLLVGIAAALLTLILAILTGRKPTSWQTFMQYRQTSQRFRSGVWTHSKNSSSQNAADVVDVQAREVGRALDDQR